MASGVFDENKAGSPSGCGNFLLHLVRRIHPAFWFPPLRAANEMKQSEPCRFAVLLLLNWSVQVYAQPTAQAASTNHVLALDGPNGCRFNFRRNWQRSSPSRV